MYINLLSNALTASACCEAIRASGMFAQVINVVCDSQAVLMLVSSEIPLPRQVADLSQSTVDGVMMFVVHDDSPAKTNGKAAYVNSLDEIGRGLTIIKPGDTKH